MPVSDHSPFIRVANALLNAFAYRNMSSAAKSAQYVRQPSGYFVGFNSGFKVTKILKKRRAADNKGVRNTIYRYLQRWRACVGR